MLPQVPAPLPPSQSLQVSLGAPPFKRKFWDKLQIWSYQYLAAWPADGLWHPKCHREANFLVSPELAPEKKSKKCGRRMEDRNPKRCFLVGGFNPFEKLLVKLEHFPK